MEAYRPVQPPKRLPRTVVRPDRPPMPLEQLVPYYRGAFFATVLLKRRFREIRDRDTFMEIDCYQRIVKEYRVKKLETVEQSL